MRTIIWSVESEFDYQQNIDFLLSKWTEKEAQNFISEVLKTIVLLQKGNVEFKDTDYKGIRSVKITSQIILFYRVKSKNLVELVRFWNTYQDPKKLKLK